LPVLQTRANMVQDSEADMRQREQNIAAQKERDFRDDIDRREANLQAERRNAEIIGNMNNDSVQEMTYGPKNSTAPRY